MNTLQQIQDDIIYLGGSENRHTLFENIYPVSGMSYNSYLIRDEKTTLMDTADTSIRELFLENLTTALMGKALDYIVVHHMEPDHAALLDEIMMLYPSAKIVCNTKIQTLISQFFNRDISNRIHLVSEGDSLSLGKHTLTFVMAPMVHWPEVMVSYDSTTQTLFSADAFGTFGELKGCLFADSWNLESEWLPEARRYYANIVGKYGMQVQSLLKKAATLSIQTICPLHGPIWRKDLGWLLDKYQKWSTYTPEDKGVLILYGSIYGHTENAARVLGQKLARLGICDVALYDVSKTHPSIAVSEAFRCKTIVFASSTYNNGIFTPMETTILDLKAHALQNRSVAIIQNGSWAPVSGKLIRAHLDEMKNMTIYEPVLTIKSALKAEQEAELIQLAQWIAEQ